MSDANLEEIKANMTGQKTIVKKRIINEILVAISTPD